LGRSNHDGLDDVALFHRAVGRGLLHGADDDVADLRVLLVSLEHANDEDFARPGIVRDATARVGADHALVPGDGWVGSTIGISSCPLLTSRATTQCFSRLNGLLSRISTTSPVWYALAGSCALNLCVRRIARP